MNTSNALRGTRMGRKVEDPAAVIAELASYKTPEEFTTETTPSPAKSVDFGSLDSRIERLANGHFLFSNVPYQDKVLAYVERALGFVDGGNKKTQTEHVTWLAERAQHPEGYTLAPMELEYQMLRICFDLRDHPSFGPVARDYMAQIRGLLNGSVMTADRISYQAFPSVDKARFGNAGFIPSKTKSAIITGLQSSNLELSSCRPEHLLENTFALAPLTDSFLKEYLGFGYERAGIIFPYCSNRKETNLRQTRLWVNLNPPKREGTYDINVGCFGIPLTLDAVIISAANPQTDQLRAMSVAVRTEYPKSLGGSP